MKIINNSKNTVYLEDIDIHIQYKNGEPEEISPEVLKKSKTLRNLIVTGFLDVSSYDENEKIENSVMYMRSKQSPQKEPEQKTENSIPLFHEITSVEQIHPVGKIEVKLHGMFFDAGGYSKVNRNLAIQLSKLGFHLKIDPKRTLNQLREDEIQEFVHLEKTELSKNHIRIDSVIPTFSEPHTGRYKILYTTVESYTLPKQFTESCELYNEIWVTSPFAKEILEKYTTKPIYVIPAGVDEELYTMNGPKFDFSPNVKSFVFVSVFGWNYRKGYDVLLKAYFDEFSSDDDVSLLIMSRYQGGTSKFHKNKIKEDIEKIMEGFPNKNLPHIVRYNQILPEKDMPKLYRAANCFVLYSRGESSCLTPVEGALCGLPVIMTNLSGQRMYLREDNSYLVEMDKLEHLQSGLSNVHFWDGQQFPLLTSTKVHNDARKSMRFLYDSFVKYNYLEPKEKNRKMRELILNNFTWKHTAKAAAERLNDIWSKKNW